MNIPKKWLTSQNSSLNRPLPPKGGLIKLLKLKKSPLGDLGADKNGLMRYFLSF
jgi:hypothetical protein